MKNYGLLWWGFLKVSVLVGVVVYVVFIGSCVFVVFFEEKFFIFVKWDSVIGIF